MLEGSLGGVRLSADDWLQALAIDLYDEAARARVEALQWEHAQTLLRRGMTVIIEWGTWARVERDALRVGARALGAAVELHHVTATADVLLERIQRRGREDPRITADDIRRWSELFQAPTTDEISLYDKSSLPDDNSTQRR